MHHKKLIPITLVTAILYFAVEYGWYMMAMKDTIAVNTKAGIPWHDITMHGWVAFVLAAILFGFAFSAIFLAGYQGKGAVEGVRFAILATILASVVPNVGYGVGIDFGRHFIGLSIAGDLITFIICGVVAATMAGASTAMAAAKA